ncbi:MAG: mechanosensitive ion channel [Candidatus Eremiobacteraeota bacterium]|nr:mechanosensitive ion channel [Candidatus Eremiobacteraeota bacterium]
MPEAQRVLTQDLYAVFAYVPHVIGAVLILLVGLLAAWIISRLVQAVLARLGFDHLGERTGLTDDLAAVGIRARPSSLVGRVAFFFILLATLVQAADTLELAPLSDALRNLLIYSPHVIVAIVLVLMGVIVGDRLASGASGAMSRAGVLHHGTAGTLIRAAIIVLAVLMALQQLTIESAFLFNVFLVVLSAAALAAAIAGGWGARSFAENLVAARFIEQHFHIGDSIDVDGIAGKIEELGITSTAIRTPDDRRIIVPNAILTQSAVAVDPSRSPGDSIQPS